MPARAILAAMIPLHLLLLALGIALICAAVCAVLILKAFALWYAARNNQKAWFIVLLFVQTAGILDIVYLAFFRKDKNARATAPVISSPEA